MKKTFLLVLGIVALGISNAQAVVDLSKYPTGELVGKADLQTTTPGNAVKGEVRFFKTDFGLRVVGNVEGLIPGKHGIHIHENGDCAEAGKAAGGHYNPHGVAHGFIPKDTAAKAHVGDMGNVTVDSSGHGDFSVDMVGVHMNGVNPVDGKAVILHEKEDDFGQPTGNAGGRIACGIIQSGTEEMLKEDNAGAGSK